MMAHWYDWGFTNLDGMSASLPGNKPMSRSRRRNRNPRQVQQPDIDGASSIVVEATPANAQPSEHAPRTPLVYSPAPRWCHYGPSDGPDTSIERTNMDEFRYPDPTYEKRYGPRGATPPTA